LTIGAQEPTRAIKFFWCRPKKWDRHFSSNNLMSMGSDMCAYIMSISAKNVNYRQKANQGQTGVNPTTFEFTTTTPAL
jgi:hypothetical protein